MNWAINQPVQVNISLLDIRSSLRQAWLTDDQDGIAAICCANAFWIVGFVWMSGSIPNLICEVNATSARFGTAPGVQLLALSREEIKDLMVQGLEGDSKEAYHECFRKLHFAILTGSHTAYAAKMANEILRLADQPGCTDESIIARAAVNMIPMNVMYMLTVSLRLRLLEWDHIVCLIHVLTFTGSF
jgi:hypothetical protein